VPRQSAGEVSARLRGMRISFAKSLTVTATLLLLCPSIGRAAAARQGSGIPYLMELPGVRVHVRYSGGSLDRAANLQRRFEWMLEAVSRWSHTAVGLQLTVVDREGWAVIVGERVPYGVPALAADGTVVVPAHGGPDTVALWHDNLGLSLPRVQGKPLVGTPEDVASLAIADLMAELEVAHVMLAQAGIHGASPQIDALLTMTTAWDAWYRFESDRLPEIERILSQLASNPHANAPPFAWFAAAARTLPAARRIVEASGHRPMRRLAKLAQHGDGSVSACALLDEFKGLANGSGAPAEPVVQCGDEK
jgi:hypothetical protein